MTRTIDLEDLVISCPSIHERLYWKVMYGPKSRIIMLASNIIKKTNNDFKVKAIQIFSQISHVFGFQHILYQFKGIENFLKND